MKATYNAFGKSVVLTRGAAKEQNGIPTGEFQLPTCTPSTADTIIPWANPVPDKLSPVEGVIVKASTNGMVSFIAKCMVTSKIPLPEDGKLETLVETLRSRVSAKSFAAFEAQYGKRINWLIEASKVLPTTKRGRKSKELFAFDLNVDNAVEKLTDSILGNE